MGLFKSEDERRIERQMRLKAGVRAIEKSIRQQEKFTQDFLVNARHARKIGDRQQYQFVRNALKRTAGVKRMLERQLLSMKNAMVLQQQAEAGRQFAESMSLMAKEIGRAFAQTDVARTQAQWEKASLQAATLEERMDLFLETLETAPADGAGSGESSGVSDDEIDRLIDADVLAEEQAELSKLDELDREIARELSATKQRD